MPIESIDTNEEIDFVDPNLLVEKLPAGFINGFPLEGDETVHRVANDAFRAAGQITDDELSKLSLPAGEVQPIRPAEVAEEDVKDFLEVAKEYEEETGVNFSMEELERLFVEYVKYLGECKRAMVNYKNKVKEIFNQIIKSQVESYRKPWELIASGVIAGLYTMSAVGSFAAGTNKTVQQTFIAGCSGLANAASPLSNWLSTKMNGERTKLQLLGEDSRTTKEDINQATQQPGRKQEEVEQKYSQSVSAKSEAARQINS